MKIGKIRKELSKILTEITGFNYPPDGISQTNRTQDKRKRVNQDAYYWYAMPNDKHGAVISSPYTMRAIITAYKCNKECIIYNLDTITIKVD